MTDNYEEIEGEIDSLLCDERYVQLTRIEPEFDLFDFLESLSEEATSRALAFLFDSSREHGLDTSFFDAFVENVHREGKARTFRLSLRQSLALHGASTSVTTEWPTLEGRRLDLLIRVYDSSRNLVAVVGIENKHWADEQPEQVAHYQQELVSRFPHVQERVLFFLSPGARPSSTADLTSPCPHLPCSCQSVTSALAEVEQSTSGEMRVLIGSLRNHLDKNLEGSQAMSAKIRDLVRALYTDDKHRNAIKHILDYIPRFGALVEEIQAIVERHLTENYPDEPFEFETYPEKQLHRLQTISLWPTRLYERTFDRAGFSLGYTLHADRTKDAADVPDLGDHVTVQVMAWCERKECRQSVEELALPTHFPASMGTPHSWYSLWKEVWAGGSHRLADLASQDVEACAALFCTAIDATFPILREVIEREYFNSPEDNPTP